MKKILEHLPDIIILDMTMTGKAGLEVGTNGKMLLTVWLAGLSPSEVGLKALPALPTKKSDAQANCNLGARCKEKQPPPGTARL